MSVSKKVLLNAAATMVLAGAAHAAVIGTPTVGGISIGTGTYNLANEIAFTTAAPVGTVVVPVLASTGTLPSGNVLLDVSLTNAVFSSQVLGAAVTATGAGCSLASSVLSTGGGTATGSVTFVLSGLTDCEIGDGVAVTLPVRVTGAGSVGVSATFRTEASVPVDGGTTSRGASLITLGSAFAPTVTADSATTQLTLASGFKAFAGDTVLGAAGVVQPTATFYSDLSGTATDPSDVTSVTVSVSGDFTGFGTGTGNASLLIDGVAATITGSTASRTVTGSAAADFVGTSAPATIEVVAGTGTSAAILNASTYSATVTASYDTSVGYASGTETASGALDQIVREGTTILLPWTSSQSNAAVTGSNNIVRVGNRTTSAINGVFVRVINTSTSGFTNSGLVALGSSIPAGGELLITSELLQQRLGDFGRGDIELVIEAAPSALSVRRLVARPDGVFDFGSGAQ